MPTISQSLNPILLSLGRCHRGGLRARFLHMRVPSSLSDSHSWGTSESDSPGEEGFVAALQGAEEVTAPDGTLEFEKAPGLGYTKLLEATVAGKQVAGPYWKTALLAVIDQLRLKGYTGQSLVEQLNVPTVAGKFEERGFQYFEQLGVSIQGQSATSAWKEMERLAKKWGFSAIVEFSWYDNPKAQFPGKRGRLKV